MNWYADNKPGTPLPTLLPNPKLNDPALYLPGPGLRAAVDVALALGQPLLLTGEPGTGKSQLADHIAWYFELEDKPAVVPVQTTSVAKDLYYRYDALGHFQHNQHSGTALDPDELEKQFINFQGLGKAIREKKRMVVLIDEIDKAPRDLPNDILTALDRLAFDVPEVKKSYETKPELAPIVIITSNSEKNLPDPFLRRVVYYHIPTPKKEELLAILAKKMTNIAEPNQKLLVEHFDQLRGEQSRLRKKPSTAELLLWADLLVKMKFDPRGLEKSEKLSSELKDKLKQSYTVLAKTQEDLEALYQQLEL